jgi:hypothetical protein
MKKLAKLLLQLAALGLLALAFLLYQMSQIRPGEMEADHPDIGMVASVLSGASLELTDSFQMSGNWSGDIDRGFAARVADFDWQSLSRVNAYRGDQLPGNLASATEFAVNNLGQGRQSWFPSAAEIMTERYFVYGLNIEPGDHHADSAQMLFLRPEDGMVFYSWVKF